MKIVRLLLLILGFFLIFIGVKAILGADDAGAALEGAIVLESPAVLPENEGKIVILHGRPEIISPVYDEELGLTLQTVKALRYQESYDCTGVNDGKYTYKWMPKGMKTLVGTAKVGEYTLAEQMISSFPAERDYQEFDAQEASRYALDHPADSRMLLYVLPKGAYYYPEETTAGRDQPRLIRESDRDTAEQRAGTIAYRYRCFDPQMNEEMTFVGRQQGSVLADCGVDGVARVHTGIKTREELIGSDKAMRIAGSLAGILCGAALLLFALFGRKAKANAK